MSSNPPTMSRPLCITNPGPRDTTQPLARPRSRFWTTQEIQVLFDHFPTGGADACHAQLPHRSKQAIYNQAHRLDIAGHRKVWESSEHIDRMIRISFQQSTEKGSIKRLAERIGRSRWWIRQRAIAMGIAVPRFKEPDWSAVELKLLEENAHKTPKVIASLLRRHGFKRTATAVAVKRKRKRFDTTDYDHYSAHQLAEAMGVDAKTICRWIDKYDLKATRKGTARTDLQGGDTWWISRKAVRNFIADNVAVVDIRKADKFWLVDLLVGKYQ